MFIFKGFIRFFALSVPVFGGYCINGGYMWQIGLMSWTFIQVIGIYTAIYIISVESPRQIWGARNIEFDRVGRAGFFASAFFTALLSAIYVAGTMDRPISDIGYNSMPVFAGPLFSGMVYFSFFFPYSLRQSHSQ